MNILIDSLPESVPINGREWPVNWGYRAFLLIEICMFDSARDEGQRVLDALNIFYNRDIPPDMAEAMGQMQWFYRCGEKDRKPADQEKNKTRRASPLKLKRCYDFGQDAPYVYAAFLTQYGIDLNSTKNYDLHWWKFRAMFISLGEDLKLSKIMYYRVVSTTGMGKQQRVFVGEKKKLYALEDPDTNTDGRMKLAKRNMEMKEYVRRRMREVSDAKEG